MSKAVFLLVSGDGDYGAMYFEDNFNEQEVYKSMLAEGVKKKILTHEEKWGEESIYVSIHEFEEVDSKFVSFMVDEFMDYDYMKAKNFFRVV